MLFVFLIYVSIALVALYSFKDSIKTDILGNFDGKSDGYAIIL